MAAELTDGGGGPSGGEWVQADGEVAVDAGVDVALPVRACPGQGVGFVLAAV